jgi:hypothetical protein
LIFGLRAYSILFKRASESHDGPEKANVGPLS